MQKFTKTKITSINKKMEKYSHVNDSLQKSFSGLKFDEESHTYTYNNQKLTSTTTYLKQFVNPFNAFFVSRSKARTLNAKFINYKLSSKYFLRRYSLISQEALGRGNRIHEFAEQYPYLLEPYCDKEQGIIEFFLWLHSQKKYVVVCSELRVYDKALLKAGTIDLLLFNIETEKLVIVDWKSNLNSMLLYYNKGVFKHEFKDYPLADYYKYSLQLSDYKNIIETNTKYEVEGMMLVHLHKKNTNSFKYKDKNKYSKLKIRPLKIEENYRVFSAKDFSKELKEVYVNRAAPKKPNKWHSQ